MRLVVAAVVLAACSSKADKPAPQQPPPPRDAPPVAMDADPRMKAVAQPVPPGPYAVAYDCMHSNMPFGKGGWFRNQSADLAKNEWALLEVTTTGDDVPATPDTPAPEPALKPVSVPVSAQLVGAIDRVLAGGPYVAEYPVPEGTPCTLTIRTAGDGATVFAIEKADTAEHDAVSDLVVLFRSVAGT